MTDRKYRRARAGILVNEIVERPTMPEPANDNSISWPLVRTLKRSGSHDLAIAALQYRRLYDRAHAEELLRGVDWDKAEFFTIVQRTWFNPKTGELEYKGVSRPKSADRADFGTVKSAQTKSSVRCWNGDEPLLAKVDAERQLAALRATLGPLRQPFEEAVVHGATLEAIGEKEGFKGKQAEAVGKAFALRGLLAIASDLLCNGEPYQAAQAA